MIINVYSDVVNNDLILPKKAKYTKKDYEKLLKQGFEKSVARFICVCSAIYHGTEYSRIFDTQKFRFECGIL